MLNRLREAWRLYKYAARDARTPFAAKLLPWLAVAYFFWPVDFIPDVIPIVGYTDDVAVIIALCIWALRLIPDSVKRDARSKVIDIEPR